MIKFPTSVENNGDEQQHFCAALRRRSFLEALSAAVEHHERHVEPPGPLAQASLNPWQASSEERRQSSDLLCSLRHILPSSPTTPGRVLKSRAVHQGRPKTKIGLCLALVGALELPSAADWNILIFHPKCMIRLLGSIN
jgi:hypothetical protein